MNKKICLISSVLLFTLILLGASFASSINVNSSVSGENVVLTVNGVENTIVNLIVEDDTRFYFIDQKTADENGQTIFNFVLSQYENKTYNYKIKSSGDLISGIIKIKTEDLVLVEDEDEDASIKVVGYNNNIILSKISSKVINGDTVLSFTKRILDDENIDYDNQNGYLASINGLEQFDKGAKSGWMFSVNNKFPGIGADNVNLHTGDYIKWLYTSDLGIDVGNGKYEVPEEIKYDLFSDESSSEKELSRAIENLQDSLNSKIKGANTEKEKNSVINEANKIYESILTIPSEKRTEQLSKDIIDNSIKTIENILNMIDEGNSSGVKEGIDDILKQNMGLILYLVDGIKEADIVDKYIENVFKMNDEIQNKSDGKNITNKSKMKILEFDVPQGLNESNEFSMPLSLLEKAREAGIDHISIKNDITVFNITPNIIKSNEKGNKLSLSSSFVDKNTLSDEENKLLSKDSVLISLKAKLGEDELTNFNDTIEVSIKYDGNVKNNDEVTVFLLKSDGSIEPVGGVYDEKTKTIKFLTNHFSNYFVKSESKTFSDVITHWASNEINTMASKGIITGKSEELFVPDENITRAEFSVLISRMLKLKSNIDKLDFNDISDDDWYYDDIVSAFENNIINGRSETEFDPSSSISRQETAKIISNILLKNNYIQNDMSGINIFIDKDEISDWAKDDVALVVREEIFGGVSNNSFGPLENLTRAQAATIIYRLYKLLLG